MDVADTICREAGFPGAYETTWSDTTSGSNGTSYQCNTFTHRLQDCENITSSCTDAYKAIVINCNVLGQLVCFNLAAYTHLLSRTVKLRRDQCLTHCKSYSATPQYAVHHTGTNCSCVNQTALDVTKLTTDRDLCRTNTTDPTGHWATLFNVSFGFCSEPPEVDNGSWNNTSNGFMYGTTIFQAVHSFCGGTKSTSKESLRKDPEEQALALQKIRPDSSHLSESIVQAQSLKMNTYPA
eukprot:XP_011679805.1 PREDICTED: uncharacterized protein LOC105445672 [Strongylocentrotus purpuratus]